MRKVILSLVAASLMFVGLATSLTSKAYAFSSFWETFTGHFNETWYPLAFENGVRKNNTCGATYCTSFEHDNILNWYWRLKLKTNVQAGTYNDVEIHTADEVLNTGEKFVPTVGHPVVFQSRIRFDAGYNPDGTGAAVGTAGLGVYRNQNPGSLTGPLDSFSFQWLPDEFTDAFGMDGFTAVVARNGFPISVKRPVSPINLQEWNFVRIVWSQLESGDQTVEFFINGESLGVTTLLASVNQPLPALGGYIWLDNQWYDNTFTKQLAVPSYEQHFDADFIRITQW